MHHVQKLTTAKHERQQDQIGNETFAYDHSCAALRIHLPEQRGDDRQVAQGIEHQKQQDKGRNEISIHQCILPLALPAPPAVQGFCTIRVIVCAKSKTRKISGTY